MTSTVLEKADTTKTLSKVKTKKKSQMSYAEAIDVIHSCDAIIKEAATNRVRSSVESVDLRVYSTFKVFGTFLTVLVGGATSAICELLIDPVSVAIFATGVVGMISSLAVVTNEKLANYISPICYKKDLARYQNDQQFVALKEYEFAQVEQKVLKKAEKARKVIDEALRYENKGVVYSNTPNWEGFVLKELAPLNSWEQEKLRLQRQDSLKELEPAKAVKTKEIGMLA